MMFKPVHARFMSNSKSRRVALTETRDDRLVEHSVGEVQQMVHTAASSLRELGVKPGDRVCLLVPTSLSHTVLDIATLCLGGVVVPVYDTDSAEQIAWIVEDASPVVFVAAHDALSRVQGAFDSERHACVVVDADDLERAFRERDAEVEALALHESDAGDPACIVYTSGTTGRPKGCVLTHGNLTAAIDGAHSALPELFSDVQRTVLFLPLAHVFARIVQYGCLAYGVSIGYSSPDRMLADVAVMKPTWLVAVPRVLEKVYASARAKTSGAKRRVFDGAAWTARRWAVGAEQGAIPAWLEPLRVVSDKLVFSHLRAALGGEIRYVVSGGAALDAELSLFFAGAGITVFEGYGLTETTAAHTVNTMAARRSGTVGLPVGDAEVKIRDGEVLLRGSNVFSGYWRNETATEAVFENGWFCTGDLGELAEGGFLKITGRRKELIVTSGGKNVQPVGLEETVCRSEAVMQCVVVGDGEPFIAALVALDAEWLAKRAHELGVSIDEARKHATVRDEVQRAIDAANEAVSRAESIREWRVLNEEMSVANGMLTPTLKTKRGVVAERHAALIAEMYEAKHS
jgi:long-chain acyl-CoA synthetase